MTDVRKQVFEQAFELQKNVIRSKEKRKVLFIGRRAGKTYLIAIYMLMLALTHNRVKIVYLGLTKAAAENAMWTHCLEELLLKFHIAHNYHIVNRVIKFANGSTIRMSGADTNYREIKKELGGKVFLAIIDECQDQTQDLEEIVKLALQPAVSDYILQDHGGQIIMAGTAGQIATDKNYWYRITKDVNDRYDSNNEEWKIFHWNHTDNPHMKEQKEAELQGFLDKFGLDYVKTDWFRTQYLCHWITDSDGKVYRYIDNKCQLIDQTVIMKLQNNLFTPKLIYILGTDLGHDDDCAFTLGAWHKHSNMVYIIKSEKHKGMSLDELGAKLNEYKVKYKPSYFPIDTSGSGKIIVEDFRKRYKIPFEVPKSKTDKLDFIQQMNSDFLAGRIQIIKQDCLPLIEEWQTLLRDKRAWEQGYFKEAERFANHCADSALYMYSNARHYQVQPEPIPQDINEQQIDQFTKIISKQQRKDKLQTRNDAEWKW